MYFPEKLMPVRLLKPAADAAGRSGGAVSLKNALKAWIVFHVDQGNAATILLTPEQCTNVAGAGNKAIPASPIYTNQDAGTASPMAKQTDAATFTTSAAVKEKIVVIEIDPSTLDVTNGFDCIRLTTGASNAANITEAMLYILPRYAPLTQDALAN